MLVGVNVFGLQPGFAGLEVCLRNVLATMGALQKQTQFVLFTRPDQEEAIAGCKTAPIEQVKDLDAAARRIGVDVLLSPLDDALPKSTLPLVLLAMDLRPTLAITATKGWFGRSPGAAALQALQSAKAIIAPSEFIKRALLESFEVPMDRVVLAPLGVSEEFATPQPSFVEEPYILLVGTTAQRRGVPETLKIFNQLKPNFPHNLIVVGRAGDAEPKDWGSRVLRIDGVPARRLAALYQHASLFVNPSPYEGSGVTVLEAMKAGAPVACGRVGGIPEVAHNAPVYYNAERPDTMLAAIRRTIEEEPAARAQRIQAGRKLAADFTWENCAWKMLQAFKRI